MALLAVRSADERIVEAFSTSPHHRDHMRKEPRGAFVARGTGRAQVEIVRAIRAAELTAWVEQRGRSLQKAAAVAHASGARRVSTHQTIGRSERHSPRRPLG
jgi:hypothetical protein